MTDATKATPLSADIQPKIGEYTSPGVQTPPPAIPQDQLTGKTHGRNPSRARARSQGCRFGGCFLNSDKRQYLRASSRR